MVSHGASNQQLCTAVVTAANTRPWSFGLGDSSNCSTNAGLGRSNGKTYCVTLFTFSKHALENIMEKEHEQQSMNNLA